jgi:hypothetical protein
MTATSVPGWLWRGVGAFGLLLGVALVGQGQPIPPANAEPVAEPVAVPVCAPQGPRCLEDLKHLEPCQLGQLFTSAEMGHPLEGCARGRLLYVTDRWLPKAKVWGSGLVWRGKMAQPDGYFTNRWIGNVDRIDSHYVIGPSWIDGRPAVVMEYAPGTALFWNMHDELREIAPGLYLGPVFERFPCPKFRGWVALQCEPCKGKPKCRCQ